MNQLDKRLAALERDRIEKEKEAYELLFKKLTKQELNHFFQASKVDYPPARNFAEAVLDWSIEVRFYEALVEVFGCYPKVALACLETTEQELGLIVGPAIKTIPDRINQIISCFKGLAEAEEENVN